MTEIKIDVTFVEAKDIQRKIVLPNYKRNFRSGKILVLLQSLSLALRAEVSAIGTLCMIGQVTGKSKQIKRPFKAIKDLHDQIPSIKITNMTHVLIALPGWLGYAHWVADARRSIIRLKKEHQLTRIVSLG